MRTPYCLAFINHTKSRPASSKANYLVLYIHYSPKFKTKFDFKT